MANIDKISETVEKITEKIRGLKYKFNDEGSEEDANDDKEAAIAALESWLETVTFDYEMAEDEENENDD